MRNSLFMLFVLFALPWTSSCEKENPVEKQEEKIEAYIKTKMSRNPALKLSHEKNVYYLYEPGDTTVSVSAGDLISFYYAGTLLNDTSRYFDTNYEALANALKLDMTSEKFEPIEAVAGNNSLLPGLSTGLDMVHSGDAGEIIFNSDMGFGEKGNGLVPPFSPLIFKIVIVGIQKN